MQELAAQTASMQIVFFMSLFQVDVPGLAAELSEKQAQPSLARVAIRSG
jgi:predicted transcriptional regulator